MSLKHFISSKMRMAQIYQPVVIKTLLLNHGKASRKQIATEILKYDPSQVEYYEHITDNMVGRILRKHKIIERSKQEYSLKDFSTLKPSDIEDLSDMCDQKINDFLMKRGDRIWQHRRKSRTPIASSIKYQVLKRAKFRCELCGISADEKALEVDHIIPKNTGGEDSINNYQALCYTHNSMKRDLDDEDFRMLGEMYKTRQEGCIFCELDEKKIIAKNNLAVAFYDTFPVSDLHTLIVPLRHVSDYFDLTQPEINAIHQLITDLRSKLVKEDKSIEGFNIGINSGDVAGQTIDHCHIHLIPRREGDVDDPVGGVRDVIPGKGNYLKI